MKLRLVPKGYEGPTEITTHFGTWEVIVQQIVKTQLGVEWKLELPRDHLVARLQLENPMLRSPDNLNQAQLKIWLQERVDLKAELCQVAQEAFKDQLGVDAVIREMPLPVVLLEPVPLGSN